MNLLFVIFCAALPFCVALPVCCQNPSLYSDFMSAYSCNVTCTWKHEHVAEMCIPCLTRIMQILSNSNGLDGSNATKLVVTCQGVLYKENKYFGSVVLTWSKSVVSPIFLIESRNSTLDEWSFVGMTNETVVYIDNLDAEFKYQFRVIPFLMPGLILPALISDWIAILSIKESTNEPRNLIAKNFRYKDNSVEATVEWNSSKGTECAYTLLWFPSSADEFYAEKSVNLSSGSLSTVLSNLTFEAKYILKLSMMNSTCSNHDSFAQTSFVTPSCLSLTEGNFTLCAPGPPQNLTASSISHLKAKLAWLPPVYTSPENELLGYHISVIEGPVKHFHILQYKESLTVDKDILHVTIGDLKPTKLYFFKVKAISYVGTGPPAVVSLEMEALNLSLQSWHYIPWHYVLPSCVLALFVLIAAVSFHLLQARKRLLKHKGYPSGSADVPDHVRPFLLQSKAIDLQEVIGRGEFGTVHKALYSRKKNEEIVAVKIFPAESMSRSKLLQEVEVLQTVGRHHNVVGLIGFTLDVDKMFLVLEYCALGNLHSRLRKLRKELSVIKRQLSDPKQPLIEKGKEEHYGIRLCSYIHQIALGMDHISSLRMIHRDLAARNILLCDERHVKIADFGLARDIYETHTYTVSKQKKLPIRWMAPEAIETHTFTIQSDVWSFGVLMWEIFKFGKIPYPGLCNSDIRRFLKHDYRLSKPQATSQYWYDLMLHCWQADPLKRPTFKQLVQKTESILSRLCHYTVVDS